MSRISVVTSLLQITKSDALHIMICIK